MRCFGRAAAAAPAATTHGGGSRAAIATAAPPRPAAAAAAIAAASTPRQQTAVSSSSSSSSRGLLTVAAAKKGGGGGGKGKKGGGGGKGGGGKKGALADLLEKKSAAAGGSGGGGDELASPAQYADPELSLLLLAICQSYWKAYGQYLMESVDLQRLPEALYKAPFVVLAHNKFLDGVADPEFVYANRAALRLFEGAWDEVVGMPSRLSADETVQEERNALLQQAADSGAIENYEGWRRSLKGKRFKIRGVRLFNVTELTGDLYGQAVVFSEYEEEDGTVVKVEGEAPPPAELPPTEEELAAAAAAVEAQAAAVRALKEGRGLGNQDPEVAEAVAELRRRKDAEAALRAKWADMVGGGGDDEDDDDGGSDEGAEE